MISSLTRFVRSSSVAAAAVAVSVLVAAVAGQELFQPARFRDGGLPPTPFQAIAGGEVFVELSVTARGDIGRVTTLRATPPFTEPFVQTIRQWRLLPADEEVEPQPGAPRVRRPVDSKVLVAGFFRPPAMDTPTFSGQARDPAAPADDVCYPLTTVAPVYPPLARDDGTVLLEVQVDAGGRVADAAVLRSAPPFDEPALAAARQWRFKPALIHGVPTATVAYLIFSFRQPVTVANGR
jgi:TonB family protein